MDDRLDLENLNKTLMDLPLKSVAETLAVLKQVIEEDESTVRDLMTVMRNIQVSPITKISSILRQINKKKMEEERTLAKIFDMLSTHNNVHIVRKTRFFSLDFYFKYNKDRQTKEEISINLMNDIMENISSNCEIDISVTPDSLCTYGTASVSLRILDGIGLVMNYNGFQHAEIYYGEKISVNII